MLDPQEHTLKTARAALKVLTFIHNDHPEPPGFGATVVDEDGRVNITTGHESRRDALEAIKWMLGLTALALAAVGMAVIIAAYSSMRRNDMSDEQKGSSLLDLWKELASAIKELAGTYDEFGADLGAATGTEDEADG